MQDNDFAAGNCDINPTSNTVGCLGSQLPELAFEMLDMRLVLLFQPDPLDRFQKAEQTRLQTVR
jgi:hypothetical protein